MTATKTIAVPKVDNPMKRCTRIEVPTSTSDKIYAAWGLVLTRHFDVEDVVYGFMGAETNVVPLKLSCEPGMEIGSLLHQIKEQTSDSNSEVQLNRPDTMSVETVIKFIEEGCDFMKCVGPHHFSHPLILFCEVTGPITTITGYYDERFYDLSRTTTMLSHMRQVLTRFHGDTTLCLRDINIFTSDDYKEISNWNLHAPKAIETTIPELFEQQVKLRPLAPAICSWDGNLTYAELDDKSRRLARKLVEMGATKQIVPLCLEKSTFAIICVLAVLRAGGAFTHLGVTNPTARMRNIADACKATIILCSPTQKPKVEILDREILVVDDELIENLSVSTTQLPSVSSNDVASIQFTSGSTGTPKGIVLEHGSFATTCEAIASKTMIGPETRVWQFSAYTFDVSSADILFSLSRGACICSPSEDERLDSIAAAAFRMKVNYVFLTTSVLSLIHPSDLPSLKTILVGGERISKEIVEEWADNVSLHITMGPSECSIYCAVTGAIRPNHDPSNFGYAIGCRAWVVEPNDHTRLSALDCVGELLIEGRIVAREYLNDPMKTSKSFIEMPSWIKASDDQPLSRLYRTGDLVRLNSRDGSFSYVGRKDTQVKLRGQRIEFEEIEYSIKNALPDASRIIPFIRNEVGTRHSLIAFIVFTPGSPMASSTSSMVQNLTELGLEALRRMQNVLAEVLTSYMIPTLFIPIRQAPLTMNGKTDIPLLRLLVSELSQEQLMSFSLSSQTSAQSELSKEEAKLRTLWANELQIDENMIGPKSEFTRLGGDSLAAMRLVQDAAKSGLHLTVAAIMKSVDLCTMASMLSEISQQKSECPLFSLLSDESANLSNLKESCAVTCGIQSSQIVDIYPCSPVQEMLFVSSLKQPGSHVSRISYALPPSTSIDKFQSAWNEVVAKVDILRTRLVSNSKSRLLQVVVNEQIEWKFDGSLNEYWSRDAQVVMEDGQPLIRFGIIKESLDTKPVFALTCHHAIYDAFTLDMIFEQVSNAYMDKPGEELTPYKNYISHIETLPIEPSSKFWDSRLRESPAAYWPKKPKVESQPHISVLRGHAPISVQHQEFTLSMFAQTAYSLLISAYSGSSDIVFGMVGSGRDSSLQSVMKIAGPTLYTIPFRSIIEKTETVGQYMSRIRADTFELSDHAHIGLQNIRQLSSDCAEACDFRSLLVIQAKAERDHSKTFGSIISSAESVATYGLTFECFVSDGGIDIVAEYDALALSEQQVDRFIQQFSHVLSELMIRPRNTQIGDINLISPTDLAQLQIWNGRQDIEVQESIHHMIGLNMDRYPDVEAVCGWDGVFTYKELDLYSARMAIRLMKLGVTSEVIVPILTEKTVWVVVAIVGVLRAGGAFLLLDPANPDERIKDMISQVDPKTMIISPGLADKWHSSARNVLPLSTQITQWEVKNDNTLWGASHPHDLAYVVFTSGSTGRPKGVLIEHTNILSSGMARASGIRRTRESRVYQFSSYSFDTSVEDMITTLVAGGTVCIPSEEERKSDVAASINKYRANTIDTTPSMANILVPSLVPSLQIMVLGGEAMTESHVEKWAQHLTLVNTYGPAECSIVATVAESAVFGSTGDDIGNAPSGHAWVVDSQDHRKLAPIGAVGELLMSGPLVGRGYLNNASQTDEVFVRDIPWTTPETRFYKTGDLVKYQDNGNLTFVGRRDTQVKIYGQRVELSEIEKSLLTAQNVSGAAVEVSKIPNGQQQLIAFLTLGGNESSVCERLPISTSLRKQLGIIEAELIKVLPRFMIPSMYIPLTTMPLAVTGKMDRKLLRSLFENIPEDDLFQYRLVDNADNVETLKTDVQLNLQSAWCEILNISKEKIGFNSNFFRVGGDSIFAMRLSMAMRNQYKFKLSVADILQHPILGQMAEFLHKDNTDLAADVSSLDPTPFTLLKSSMSVGEILRKSELSMPEADVEDIYPCTPLQEGFMALGARQKGAYVARQIFDIPQHVDIVRFRECWDKVILANPVLRTRIVYIEDCGFLQIVCKRSNVWNTATSLDQYTQRDSNIEMTYGSPLCRLSIVHDEAHSQRYFVQTMHHSLFDGVSLEIISRQVSYLYENGERQIPCVPFNRFISYLQSVDPATSESFWRNQLEGSPSTVFMADTNVDGKSVRQGKVMKTSIAFERSSAGVLSICTPASAVRAAWALVVSIFSENIDVLFGSTLSGRNVPVPNIMEMAAPTLTTVPIRVVVDHDQTILEYVKQIQHQAIAMIPHEHYGLQNIQHIQSQATKFNHILILHAEDTSTAYDPIVHLADEAVLGFEASSAAGYYTHSLVMDCTFQGNSLNLNVFYDANIASEQRMQRIVHTFEQILKEITTRDHEIRLRDLSICSPQDHQKMLNWNQNKSQRVPRLIHDLVKDKVISCGNSIAIEAWDGTLTYDEIELRSSRLASFIAQQLDSLENLRIPFCFDKSIFTIVSMLAILKVGGAYVPLEPSYPAARLQDIAKQVDAKLVLVGPKHHSTFSKLVKHVITVDDELFINLSQAPGLELWHQPTPKVTPDSPAMIIFTSGSTGKPKGVVITHGSFSTLAVGLGPELGLNSQTRALQFAAYAFDVSNAEIFLTLIHGGCVCIPSNHERMNDLANVISRMRINWMYLTPTATSLIKGPEEVPCVKTLLIGGEAARRDIIDIWGSKVNLINTYGPAEGTIWPSITKFTTDSSPMNIGSGNNCHMWLVDPENHHRLMPIGAVGEILLEGPLLANGYHNDPDKTSQAFVRELSWTGRFGKAREFYKTGDLATYNEDGSMSFSGRIGTMVKLRGQRLDLGEVEARIKQHVSHDTRVCVELMSSEANNDRLVAFITLPLEEISGDHWLAKPNNISRTRFNELNSFLSTILPSYMIPSIFVPLNTMPTTASGKTDRKILRSWYAGSLNTDLQTYLLWTDKKKTPDTAEETRMRHLWARVLNRDHELIGTNDNFFSIGGDSLAAIRLATMARTSGLVINVADIFLYPKLADLAASLHNKSQTSNPILNPSLLGHDGKLEQTLQSEASTWGLSDIKDVYPCTAMQEGLFSLSVQQPRAYIKNHVLSLPRDINIQHFQSVWSSAIAAFDILRTRIIPHAAYGFLQVVLQKELLSWHSMDSIESVLADLYPVLPYFGNPLIRFYLVNQKSNSDTPLFVLRMHHALFDAISLQNIIDYVEKAYFGQQVPIVHPYSLFVSYARQKNSIASQNYWAQYLENFHGSIFPEGETVVGQDRRAATASISIDVQCDSNAKVTIATSLVGGWALLLASYTQTNDVIFGLTLSGRDTPIEGIESMSGPTITTIPRRVQVPSSGKAADYLEGLSRSGAELIEHQHVGLQNIMALPGLRSTCEFNNRLIIETTGSNEDGRLMQDYPLPDHGNYWTDPLVVLCSVESADNSVVKVHFTATFDENMISQWEVNNMLSQFAHIVQQLNQTDCDLDEVSVCDAVNENQAKHGIEYNSPRITHEALQTKILQHASKDPVTLEPDFWDGVPIWVADLSMPTRQAPMGAVGELCIPCASSNDATSSPPSPKSKFLSKTTYRTGDLVRFNNDNSWIYVGKKNEQIILKGRRIKLEETEEAVRRAIGEDVRLVAEVITFSQAKLPDLVVFFETRADPTFVGITEVENDVSLLQEKFGRYITKAKEYLSSSVPSYQRPTAYIPLKCLPTTAAGEIDRKQLQSLGAKIGLESVNLLIEPKQVELPLTDMELSLRSLWSQILNLEPSRISASDSWIRLGGDSVSAIRFVALSQTQGIHITVSEILRGLCLSDLAILASKHVSEKALDVPCELQDGERRVQNAFNDKVLADSITKQLCMNMADIEDVAPTTDLQASMVVAGMLPDRGWNDYLTHDFGDKVDGKKVIQIWNEIINHNASLRSVFLSHNGKMIGVVPRSVRLVIEEIACDDIDTFTKLWVDEDMKKPATVDKAILRGSILSTSKGGRFVICLSHALFDGTSMLRLRDDFVTAYEGKNLVPRPSFTSFVQYSGSNKLQRSSFWKDVLSGSQMTEIVHHPRPIYQHPMIETFSRTITKPNISSHGYTFTTLIKAAWSVVLAQWTNTTDVVFGHVVSGRSSSFPKVMEVIGNCMNFIPVRYSLQSPTVRDLLEQVHSQHISSLPFETTAFSEIVTEYTNWPNTTRFSSIVQTESMNNINPTTSSTSGNTQMKLISTHLDYTDVWVISYEDGPNVRVDICFSQDIIPPRVASVLLNGLCEIMQHMSTNVDEGIPTPPASFQELPSLPIRYEVEPLQPISNEDVLPEHMLAINTIWSNVGLHHDEADADTPFYDLAGKLEPAFHIAAALRAGHGMEVDINAIVENPTKRQQAHLLQEIEC